MPVLTIENPHLCEDTEGGWAMGFAWGFVWPAFSSDPPLVIAPDQFDAFNEGVLVGQQTAIDGLPLDKSCVSLAPFVSGAAEAFMEDLHIFEGLSTVAALLKKHFANAAVEFYVLAFTLIIPGPPPLSATGEFANKAASVRDQLASLGLDQGSLFLGAGIDESEEGCELFFSNLYVDIDSARSDVQSMDRPHWVIARWDADAAVSGGGFTVVESDVSNQ
jgi:hypothetical protein